MQNFIGQNIFTGYFIKYALSLFIHKCRKGNFFFLFEIIVSCILCNREEPSFKTPVSVKILKIFPNLYKSFLRQIFRNFFAASNPIEKIENRRKMFFEQFRKNLFPAVQIFFTSLLSPVSIW